MNSLKIAWSLRILKEVAEQRDARYNSPYCVLTRAFIINIVGVTENSFHVSRVEFYLDFFRSSKQEVNPVRGNSACRLRNSDLRGDKHSQSRVCLNLIRGLY